MKKENYLYQCKILPNGRLYAGAWTHKKIVPKKLPDDEVVFEEFPECRNGGEDYVWDGQTLTYAPLPEPEKEEDDAADQN